MTDSSVIRKLELADRALIKSLQKRSRCDRTCAQWRNAEVAKRRSKIFSSSGLVQFERFLERSGSFSIACERRRFRDIDGEACSFTRVRAASTEMWPMGTNYWVRDNALIGARYLFSKEKKFNRLGKSLLLSALTFMSSRSQLARFEEMIRSKSALFRREPGNWPYVFATISDNLSTAREESWSHKQDAWQIVIFYLIEAMERGLISPKELTSKHKKLLGLIIPFLAKVSFWICENSGSWEEIPAVRTSVRAWEHRVLIKLARLSVCRGFGGIKRAFEERRRYLPRLFRSTSFERAVTIMEQRVIREVSRDLPGEAPRYARSDARYRLADGALIYLLTIDYPYFLAARLGKDHRWAHRLETRILKTVMSLEDPLTGAIRRYKGDCYQRNGYFRNVTVHKLVELCGAPSGDASGTFVARDQVVPKGREAAWTHFVWQLAAWSGRRYLDTGSKVYKQLHDRYFERGLGLLTGAGEASLDQDAYGKPRVIGVPQLRMPECYISDRAPDGRTLVFPSPHTPLNWAVAEMVDAFGVRKEVLATIESESAS